MLWPDSIVLDGQAIPLDSVLASVSIHHGRTEIFSEPAATTCQIAIRNVSRIFVQNVHVGAELAVTALEDGTGSPIPRFTGTITDANLDVDLLTIIAAGRLSTLAEYPIGLAGIWPVEPWSARVTRCFQEAGLDAFLDLRPDPDFDPPLAARDSATAGPTTLGDYLTFLAPMIGAAVCDGLDGSILVQAIGSRHLTAPVAITPADVSFAPIWTQILPLANIVTVQYQGDQGASVTAQDEGSIALYDRERRQTIATSFNAQADAQSRADVYLRRSAYAHWNILEGPMIRGLDLQVGEAVTLSELPPAAPYDPWTPIVEGWTDQIDGASWTQLLALSDPALSGLVTLAWQDVPLPYLWNTINPATEWREALVLDSLEPV